MSERIIADAFHLWTALDEVINSPAGVGAGPYDGKWHLHGSDQPCVGCAYEEMSHYFRPQHEASHDD